MSPKTMVLALMVALTGCAPSIQTITSAPPIAGACQVTVYQTRAQATARGDIEELCIVDGSSSGSFRHSVASAIEKNKQRVCACGATNAYVESRADSGFSVATVTLVGFKYKQER